jgi:sulfite reductase (NADPH) flavoprotein alpha-component
MPHASPSLTVLFATQTGAAFVLAEFAVATARSSGIPVRLSDAATYDLLALADEERMLIITSTHDGEPPYDSMDFFDLLDESSVPLYGLEYAVVGLGDTAYDAFCAAAKRIDDRLATLGAKRLQVRKDLDVHEGRVGRDWIVDLMPALRGAETAST